MLATVMNCIYTSEIFRSVGMKTQVYTPFVCGGFAKLFTKDDAVAFLEEGGVAFFAGGTGHPYFSTDTGTTLRAIEIEADVILLAKAIDGVYDSDPRVNPEAKLLRDITYQEVQERDLKVMDASAITICRENKVPCIRVFGLDDPQNILRVIEGDMMGTVVHP